jgi:hypothetical protein
MYPAATVASILLSIAGFLSSFQARQQEIAPQAANSGAHGMTQDAVPGANSAKQSSEL